MMAGRKQNLKSRARVRKFTCVVVKRKQIEESSSTSEEHMAEALTAQRTHNLRHHSWQSHENMRKSA